MDYGNYLNIDVNKAIQFIDTKTIFKNGYSCNKKNRNSVGNYRSPCFSGTYVIYQN